MINGIRINIIAKLIRIKMLVISFSLTASVKEAFRVALKLSDLRKQIYGNKKVIKVVKCRGKYYWDLYIPGWPSKQFSRFAQSELSRIHQGQKGKIILNTLIFAITKKCPLKCEHCFEWDVLNQREVLSPDKIETIISDFVNAGVVAIHLSGGEPLVRLDQLEPIIKKYSSKADFWILTSGNRLDERKAKILKKSGLVGVIVSLDHYLESMHDEFRGLKGSYEWALTAIRNCKVNGLITAMTVCVTKEFCTEENIRKYMELAKSLGTDFVQWLEPKAVGHFFGKDVKLSSENESLLEKLYLEYNHSSGLQDFPIIDYHGYHQRRLGCFAAGNRNLYINTDGLIQPCPFCKSKTEDLRHLKVKELNNLLECDEYEKAIL